MDYEGLLPGKSIVSRFIINNNRFSVGRVTSTVIRVCLHCFVSKGYFLVRDFVGKGYFLTKAYC